MTRLPVTRGGGGGGARASGGTSARAAPPSVRPPSPPPPTPKPSRAPTSTWTTPTAAGRPRRARPRQLRDQRRRRPDPRRNRPPSARSRHEAAATTARPPSPPTTPPHSPSSPRRSTEPGPRPRRTPSPSSFSGARRRAERAFIARAPCRTRRWWTTRSPGSAGRKSRRASRPLSRGLWYATTRADVARRCAAPRSRRRSSSPSGVNVILSVPLPTMSYPAEYSPPWPGGPRALHRRALVEIDGRERGRVPGRWWAGEPRREGAVGGSPTPS